MLAADNWCLKVDEKIYGPYTSSQLKKFATEGRLAAWSLVSPAGANRWRPAKDEVTFSALFDITPDNDPSKSNFGKRSVTQTETEKETPAEETGMCNFILIFDVVSAAASRLENAILNLGPGFKITENVWTVSCDHTAIGVRNAIAPFLLPRDSLFIVDTTRGRSSWQNFPPGLNAKMTAAWLKKKK